MIFEQFTVGDMYNYCYLFADETTKEGCIVDPSFDSQKIMQVIKDHKVDLNKIILTHHHFDHVNVAAQIKTKTGAKIMCHEMSSSLIQEYCSADELIRDNDLIKIGNHTARAIHTPGHAPGSICLIVADKWLVTGDTLFIGTCGRADLPGSDPEDLYNSLQKIKQLDDKLIVCPGHHYGHVATQTLAEEKKHNPTLLARTLTEFCGAP